MTRRDDGQMHRRIFMLTSALAIAASAGMALARDFAAGILEQLHDLGFQQIEQQRTLLGRTRIVATNADGQREIILNPNSGEILRDLWIPNEGSDGNTRLVDTNGLGQSGTSTSSDDEGSGGGSGSSNSGGSGSGSGSNSGSGGSGSGSGSNSGSGGSGSGSGSGHGSGSDDNGDDGDGDKDDDN